VTQDRDTRARPGPAAAGPAAAGPAGAGDAGGDETLSEAFRSVARQLRETSQEALAPWDITPSQLRALRVLARHGGMRLSALSDHLRIAARSATEVADALEARGLVERRPDPGDRRATLVELTGHGTSVLEAIRAVSGTAAERAFDRLSQADRAHLARILRKLRD
jgi:DNA-binding MarR family transcriptional regulator